MKRRPLGVKVFSAWLVMYSLLGLLGALAVLYAYSGAGLLHDASGFVAGVWSLCGGLIFLGMMVSGIGVFMLCEWARRLTLVVVGLLVPWSWSGNQVLTVLGADQLPFSSAFRRMAVTLAWCAFVSWYFLRPSVRAQFARNAPTR